MLTEQPMKMQLGQFLHDLFSAGELTIVMCGDHRELANFLRELALRGRVIRNYDCSSPEAIHTSINVLRREAVDTSVPVVVGVETTVTTLVRFPLSAQPVRVALTGGAASPGMTKGNMSSAAGVCAGSEAAERTAKHRKRLLIFIVFFKSWQCPPDGPEHR